jgi:peptide/nickel transport system substrate-binding protein
MKRRSIFAVGLAVVLSVSAALAQGGGELRFYLRSEPKTFNPLLVADDSSETVRYLTGGVLIRFNRQTQQLEPELATSWKVSKDGRSISLSLREGVYFSDGTPFSAEDVAYTMQQLMDPALHSPTGDAFRSSAGPVTVKALGPKRVMITFPAPVAAMEKLFDQVAMLSSRSPNKEKTALGPFYLADHKPGAYILLKRNPNYWKKDGSGRQLPYLDSVRLTIQGNREIEALHMRRGEIDMINSIDSESYERLAAISPSLVRDAGPGLDSEQMWFNQVPNAPIAGHKRAWFRSMNFRRAVSSAINRDDLCRVVYRGHARPAVGPVSPANRFWFNSKLQPPTFGANAALRLLYKDGFRMDGKTLRDPEGNAVEFSLITNSGNKERERMAAMIQQDLATVGMKVNVVTLDFPSLIERITQSFNYEATLLGLVNTDLDPNAQMNLWLSSADNHQWNPRQKTPETTWEAELDRLMRAQASAVDPNKRKAHFDRVQEIVWEQAPFIYLVNKNALAAISPAVMGAVPVVLRPQTYWNVDRLKVAAEIASKR